MFPQLEDTLLLSLSRSAHFVLRFDGDEKVCQVTLRDQVLKTVILDELPARIAGEDLHHGFHAVEEVKEVYAIALYTYKLLRPQIRDLDLVILVCAKMITITLRNNGIAATQTFDSAILWNCLAAQGIVPVESPNADLGSFFPDLAYRLVVDFTLLRHLRWQHNKIEANTPDALQEVLQSNVKDLRVGIGEIGEWGDWQVSVGQDDLVVYEVIDEIRLSNLSNQPHTVDLFWARTLEGLIQQYGVARYLIVTKEDQK